MDNVETRLIDRESFDTADSDLVTEVITCCRQWSGKTVGALSWRQVKALAKVCQFTIQLDPKKSPTASTLSVVVDPDSSDTLV